MAEILTDTNFSEKTGKGKVVVDFFAEWCGPCQLLKPVFEKLSKENPDVQFYKLDVDENNETAEKFGVRSIPTVIFLDNGSEADRVMGFQNEESLKQKMKSVFKQ